MKIKELVEKLNTEFEKPSYHVVAEEGWMWMGDFVMESPRIARILREKEKIASLLVNNWEDTNIENIVPDNSMTWEELVVLESITNLNIRNPKYYVGTGTLEDLLV